MLPAGVFLHVGARYAADALHDNSQAEEVLFWQNHVHLSHLWIEIHSFEGLKARRRALPLELCGPTGRAHGAELRAESSGGWKRLALQPGSTLLHAFACFCNGFAKVSSCFEPMRLRVQEREGLANEARRCGAFDFVFVFQVAGSMPWQPPTVSRAIGIWVHASWRPCSSLTTSAPSRSMTSMPWGCRSSCPSKGRWRTWPMPTWRAHRTIPGTYCGRSIPPFGARVGHKYLPGIQDGVGKKVGPDRLRRAFLLRQWQHLQR